MTQIAAQPGEPLLLEVPAYYVGLADLLREWNDLDAGLDRPSRCLATAGSAAAGCAAGGC